MHFESFMFDSGCHGALGAAMVNRAQRVQAGFGLWNQTGAAGLAGGVEKLAQELGGETRHIAGDEKIPLRRRGFQGRVQASDGSAVLDQICRYWQPQVPVALGSTDQNHAASRSADPFGSP